MLGAIAGDIIGSVYEFNNRKELDFPLFSTQSRFTDDTVLTVATADCILNKGSYEKLYREYYRRYPDAGYGSKFVRWGMGEIQGAYGSWGNGSAMRVSPIAYACDTLEEVLAVAEESAAVTHDHPEGIKGAQAVAAAVFLARTGSSKEEIKAFIEQSFDYYLDASIANMRESYSFDASCSGTVPQAIRAFYESTDFESSIRLAVSLGGDSDTVASMTGAIAEAFYKEVPNHIAHRVWAYLDGHLAGVVKEFYQKYNLSK